ncbi:MAG TPA: methyltransferase domain-containing protein [Patescibacteria group bacterium]|nr:methyltransferase domain-containing protein [Patescibacteria group bacterium]
MALHEGKPQTLEVRQPIRWEQTSAKSFEDISRYIELPKDVSGLSFLDIGAGGSDFTATLLERGANAFAIDPLYKSRSDLKGKMKNFFELSRKRKLNFLPRQERAFERFYESIKTNPDHYKAAQAENLPFPDNYFDYVISITAITQYLDSNKDTLFAAVKEAIRVTKPHGLIQIFPFQDEYISAVSPISPYREAYDTLYEVRQKNQRALLKVLEDNQAVTINVSPTYEGSKLEILKAAA